MAEHGNRFRVLGGVALGTMDRLAAVFRAGRLLIHRRGFRPGVAGGLQTLCFRITASCAGALLRSCPGTGSGIHRFPFPKPVAQSRDFGLLRQGGLAHAAAAALSQSRLRAGGRGARDHLGRVLFLFNGIFFGLLAADAGISTHTFLGTGGLFGHLTGIPVVAQRFDSLLLGCPAERAGISTHTGVRAGRGGCFLAFSPFMAALRNFEVCAGHAGIVADAGHRHGGRARFNVVRIGNRKVDVFLQSLSVQAHRHGRLDLLTGRREGRARKHNLCPFQRCGRHRNPQFHRCPHGRAGQLRCADFEGSQGRTVNSHHPGFICIPDPSGFHLRAAPPGLGHFHIHHHRRQVCCSTHLHRQWLEFLRRLRRNQIPADCNGDRRQRIIGCDFFRAQSVASEFLHPKVVTVIDHMANGKGCHTGGQHVAPMALPCIGFIFFLPLVKRVGCRCVPCCNVFSFVPKTAHFFIGCPAFRSIRAGMGKMDGNLRRPLHGDLFKLIVILQWLQAGHRNFLFVCLIPAPGITRCAECIDQFQHRPGFGLAISHIQFHPILFPGRKGRDHAGKRHCQRHDQRQAFLADPSQFRFLLCQAGLLPPGSYI